MVTPHIAHHPPPSTRMVIRNTYNRNLESIVYGEELPNFKVVLIVSLLCTGTRFLRYDNPKQAHPSATYTEKIILIQSRAYRGEWLGEVRKLVGEIGHIERSQQLPTTASEQSFIWIVLSSNKPQVLAAYAVSGLARFRSEYGQPDEAGWSMAQRIEECLKTAWEHVEELRQAFEPWTQKKTKEQVEEISRKHERQISELERIKGEADAMEDVDWRISLYQEAMDEATHGLTRQLPGVSFDERRRSRALVTPQLIFPGQQVQAHKEVLESLKSVDPNLRDDSGLRLTIELFLLSVRQLFSIPSLHESNSVFYFGAFKIITSNREESNKLLGTQHLLLNIICDLIIQGRGVFSDFSYPERITSILFDTVRNMLQEYTGPDEHIRDAVQEIENVDRFKCMDMKLRRRALAALPPSGNVADFTVTFGKDRPGFAAGAFSHPSHLHATVLSQCFRIDTF
ncbi:hypothetical protein EI94DRAFT_1787304, partial [Lactarius quietus]